MDAEKGATRAVGHPQYEGQPPRSPYPRFGALPRRAEPQLCLQLSKGLHRNYIGSPPPDIRAVQGPRGVESERFQGGPAHAC